MNKPAVIQGSLVDAKNVAAHKCVRLSIDVPAEFGTKVVDVFGWPTMVDPVPVAIARLQEPSEKPQEAKERKRLSELRPSAQAALTCQRPDFWAFLREDFDYGRGGGACASEEEAAVIVREWCGVGSRAMLDNDPKSAAVWEHLHDRFQAWKAAGE